MIEVTLRYMNCIVSHFSCDSLWVGTDGKIYITVPGTDIEVWSTWTLDGNTSIETEPAEENA